MCERLAEIKKSYRNNVGLEGRTIFWLISEVERLERIDRVTAEALASARAEVERLKRIEDKYWEQTKVATDAESEVERLKADIDKLQGWGTANEGMERAEKIAVECCQCEKNDEGNCAPCIVAAAIRAEADKPFVAVAAKGFHDKL